jgi:hypothetical protein
MGHQKFSFVYLSMSVQTGSLIESAARYKHEHNNVFAVRHLGIKGSCVLVR